MANVTYYYGFKGGAGRSFLVASSAVALASKGNRVLVIDFDLEAPGVGDLLQAPGNDVWKQWRRHEGMTELLLDRSLPPYKKQDRDGVEKRISEFIFGAKGALGCVVKVKSPESSAAGFGNIDLLGPGKTSRGFEYLARFVRMDWSWFFENGGTDLFDSLRNVLSQCDDYDHILIDGRTGYSPFSISGIRHLADRVCVVSTFSSQSLDGVRRVWPLLHSSDPARVLTKYLVLSKRSGHQLHGDDVHNKRELLTAWGINVRHELPVVSELHGEDKNLWERNLGAAPVAVALEEASTRDYRTAFLSLLDRMFTGSWSSPGVGSEAELVRWREVELWWKEFAGVKSLSQQQSDEMAPAAVLRDRAKQEVARWLKAPNTNIHLGLENTNRLSLRLLVSEDVRLDVLEPPDAAARVSIAAEHRDFLETTFGCDVSPAERPRPISSGATGVTLEDSDSKDFDIVDVVEEIAQRPTATWVSEQQLRDFRTQARLAVKGEGGHLKGAASVGNSQMRALRCIKLYDSLLVRTQELGRQRHGLSEGEFSDLCWQFAELDWPLETTLESEEKLGPQLSLHQSLAEFAGLLKSEAKTKAQRRTFEGWLRVKIQSLPEMIAVSGASGGRISLPGVLASSATLLAARLEQSSCVSEMRVAGRRRVSDVAATFSRWLQSITGTEGPEFSCAVAALPLVSGLADNCRGVGCAEASLPMLLSALRLRPDYDLLRGAELSLEQLGAPAPFRGTLDVARQPVDSATASSSVDWIRLGVEWWQFTRTHEEPDGKGGVRYSSYATVSAKLGAWLSTSLQVRDESGDRTAKRGARFALSPKRHTDTLRLAYGLELGKSQRVARGRKAPEFIKERARLKIAKGNYGQAVRLLDRALGRGPQELKAEDWAAAEGATVGLLRVLALVLSDDNSAPRERTAMLSLALSELNMFRTASRSIEFPFDAGLESLMRACQAVSMNGSVAAPDPQSRVESGGTPLEQARLQRPRLGISFGNERLSLFRVAFARVHVEFAEIALRCGKRGLGQAVLREAFKALEFDDTAAVPMPTEVHSARTALLSTRMALPLSLGLALTARLRRDSALLKKANVWAEWDCSPEVNGSNRSVYYRRVLTWAAQGLSNPAGN